MRKMYALWTVLLAACQGTETVQVTEEPPGDVRSVHAQALVLDAHADIELAGMPSPYVGEDGKSKVEPAKLRVGGVDAVVMSIAVGPGARDAVSYTAAQTRARAELSAVQSLVADPANQLILATSPAQLLRAHEQGLGALILGLQNARVFAGDPGQVDAYVDAGVRVFALTHMGHNAFADSSRPLFLGDLGRYEPEEEHGGLSDLGRAALARINARGAVMDVSQLSKAATLEVVARSRAPVIASHSNVKALTDVRRNLSDEEIDQIAATGGVISVAPFKGYLFDSNNNELDAAIRATRRAAGINEDYDYPFELYWEIDDAAKRAAFVGAVSDVLGPGRLEDMLDHLDYLVARVGVDHVGIGTDFNHGSGVSGYVDASEAMNVTHGLMQRGYSAEAIAKIWGGNFIRVWNAAIAAAD